MADHSGMRAKPSGMLRVLAGIHLPDATLIYGAPAVPPIDAPKRTRKPAKKPAKKAR